jgi:hypothetical protein
VPPVAASVKEYGTVATPAVSGELLVMVTCAARPERKVKPSTNDFVTV